MRNLFFGAILAVSSLFAGVAVAEPVAGKNYIELKSPVPISKPGQVEVVELFWYGCPHCYQFEATLNPWVEQLPEDINFVRIPAFFGGVWNVHGQAFLTLESLGVEQKVHDAVFTAIHEEKKRLDTPESFAEFVATQGVDAEKFLSTYNSFAIKGQVAKATKLAAAYQITGVPVMIVGGKYRFDLGSSGGAQQTLNVADFLIEKERGAL